MDDSYDYLLKLPMKSLTLSNIAKHEKDLETLQNKYAALEKTYPHELWMADLQAI